MVAESFVCKKLRAVARARGETPQRNGNDPAVAEGEAREPLPEPNGNDPTVEQEGESRAQLAEQNGTDPAVEQGEESTKNLAKRNRSITPEEQEGESKEQPSQPNRNDPAVKQGKISGKKFAKQNGTDGAGKKEGESREKLPENKKKGKPVEQEDGSLRYYQPYVTSDRRNDIVDLHTLSDRLWCVKCDLPISLVHITGIEVDGLVRIYHVHCQMCDDDCVVPTSARCRDYIPKPSKSVADDSDSSAVPSTSRENGSNSVANGSESFAVPSTSRENGSNSVANGSGSFAVPSTSKGVGSNSEANGSESFAVPSTSKGIGSNSVEREYDRVIMTSPLKLKLIRSPAKNLTATMGAASTSAAETSTEAPKAQSKVEGVYKRVEGRFIIDLEWLAAKLWCQKCRLPLSLRHVLKLRVEGLVVIFRVHCRKCGAEVEAETSSKKDNENRYKVNEHALLAVNAHTKEVMDRVFESMDLLPIPTELELFDPSHDRENEANPRPEEAREENVITLESDDESR